MSGEEKWKALKQFFREYLRDEGQAYAFTRERLHEREVRAIYKKTQHLQPLLDKVLVTLIALKDEYLGYGSQNGEFYVRRKERVHINCLGPILFKEVFGEDL